MRHSEDYQLLQDKGNGEQRLRGPEQSLASKMSKL